MTDDGRADAALLAAAARGDGGAFTVLVRRYIRAATLLATQFLGDRDEADDAVQDAFTVVYRRARTFDASRPFAPWFYAIVRQLATNRRARDARRARLLRWWGRDAGAEPAVPSAEGAMLARLDADVARRALVDLSPMQRACFELVVLRDVAIEKVAAMHDISKSTVRQHVFRARTALRRHLDEP